MSHAPQYDGRVCVGINDRCLSGERSDPKLSPKSIFSNLINISVCLCKFAADVVNPDMRGINQVKSYQKLFCSIYIVCFFIYHDVTDPTDRGNLHIRPFLKEGFKRDLATCNGVVSNAGFELPSEALSLGKKLLVKPLGGQLEQISNATALAKLGLGFTTETLDSVLIAEWLTKPNPNLSIWPCCKNNFTMDF